MKVIGIGAVATLAILGLLPFALVARSRAHPSANQAIHLVLDMDKQPKFKAQRETPMFADKLLPCRSPEIPGTPRLQEDMFLVSETLESNLGTHPIPLAGGAQQILLDSPETFAAVTEGRVRTSAMADEAYKTVKPPSGTDEQINADAAFYVRHIPSQFTVTEDFLRRGQERFTIYCAPCHGESGYGDGMVAARAARLQVSFPDAVGGWTKPQNLQEAKILGRPDGNIFNTITNGIRNMPAYDKQISVSDRWAIVAYLRALQRSQNAMPGDAAAK